MPVRPLITRGLAEITRLGLALGARVDTFMGLSGLGDLVLTATGDLSRNRRVGLLLAQGNTLSQAVASLGHVAEGVYCARTVVQRARDLGVEMPISEAVVALLDGKLRPEEAVAALMEREPRARARPRPVERGLQRAHPSPGAQRGGPNARMASHFTVAARPASAYSAGAGGRPHRSAAGAGHSRPSASAAKGSDHTNNQMTGRVRGLRCHARCRP